MSTNNENSESKITVTIKQPDFSFEVSVDPSLSVLELKEELQDSTCLLPSSQRLIYSGSVLQDARTLSSYQIRSSSTLHLYETSSSNSANSSPPSNPNSKSNSNPSSNSQQDWLSSLQSMLSSNPQLQQMMKSMAGNPEFMQSLLSSNPHLSKLMEENPEMRAAFNDPQLLANMSNVASNPHLLQQMLRQQDQMLSNVENLPGGYDALQRATAEHLDPLMDGFQQQFNPNLRKTETKLPTEKQNTKNEKALPNPWAQNNNNTMAQMMNNPQMMQMMNNPQMMQQMMGGMGGMGGMGMGRGEETLKEGETWEEKYAAQILQMEAMGFTNKMVNINALKACFGNVEAAIEKILSGM